jgi:hypothetical protein
MRKRFIDFGKLLIQQRRSASAMERAAASSAPIEITSEAFAGNVIFHYYVTDIEHLICIIQKFSEREK